MCPMLDTAAAKAEHELRPLWGATLLIGATIGLSVLVSLGLLVRL